MSLVNYYGGVYFDKTIILTDHITWTMQLFNKNIFFPNTSKDDLPDLLIHYGKNSSGLKFYD